MWFTSWAAVMSNFQFNWIYRVNKSYVNQPMALQKRLKHREASVPPIQWGLNPVLAGRWPCLFMFPQFHHYFRQSYFFSRLPFMKSLRCPRRAPPTDTVSCDASHGSRRRLPWFYLEEVGKLFYSINLCTEPAVPVDGKINRCTFFVYNCSEWWITAHR